MVSHYTATHSQVVNPKLLSEVTKAASNTLFCLKLTHTDGTVF